MFELILWGITRRNKWDRAGGINSVADRCCSVGGGQNHRQIQTSPQCLGAVKIPASSVVLSPRYLEALAMKWRNAMNASGLKKPIFSIPHIF